MHSTRKSLLLVIKTVIGNVVEYYDFGIYAVFASTIGSLFFSNYNQFSQILLTFGVFASGFLMRPVGGVIFGHIGDKFGRKSALQISISTMAVSTLLIGLLPTYETIGILAPILLVLIRLVQGVCIGAEGAGSAVFLLEHLSEKRLSLVGSIIMGANILGTLLANVAGVVITTICVGDVMSWRYGFIFGSIIGLLGIVGRLLSHETPVFHQLKAAQRLSKAPIAKVMDRKKYSVLLVTSVAASCSSLAYFFRGYFSTFLHDVLGFEQELSLNITSLTLLSIVIMLPVFGAIADKVRYDKFLLATAVLVLFFAGPLLSLIVEAKALNLQMLLGIGGLTALCAAICAPVYPYAIQLFPAELRYSGVAFGWNLGNAIFGGTTPLICAFLVGKYSQKAPAYYLMFTSSIFIMSYFILYLLVKRARIKRN